MKNNSECNNFTYSILNRRRRYVNVAALLDQLTTTIKDDTGYLTFCLTRISSDMRFPNRFAPTIA